MLLFTHSYFYRFDEKQWRTAQPYPPYGTIYAAAVMRECGFEVGLFDTGLRHGPDEIAPVLAEKRPKYLVIYDDGFNYLTKMCLTRMREAAFRMAQLGKKHGCTVIVNSSDSTDHHEQYLREGADFVIHGEGEDALRELVFELEKFGDWQSAQASDEADFSKILGISFKTTQPDSSLITYHSPLVKRPVLHNLDALPDPAWDLVNVDEYRQIWLARHGRFTLNLATTRGCPYKCNWCAKPIYGNRYNSRSPQRVVAEIEMLIQKFGVRDFWMADDIFGLKPRWVQEFRDLVRERNLKFTYKIQSRVDLLLKEDSIAALAESGLRQVWVGAESGSQKILDAMDKGTTVEEIRTATRLLREAGVEVCFFLQFGYLGETWDDIQLTLRMVEELMPDDIGISVSYPLPGTKFHEKVKNLLGEKQNWTDSDDLAMMYPATFSQAFYRRLHRLVHKRFRLKQGRQQIQNLLHRRPADLRRAVRTLYYAPAARLDEWKLRSMMNDK
ncbi:MAG: B12-binding domain-containing radical SAM protein [Saprospiraceae bacterium]